MSEVKRPARGRRGRGGRESRRSAAAASTATQPYVTRKIPVFEVLDHCSLCQRNAAILVTPSVMTSGFPANLLTQQSPRRQTVCI